MPAQPKLKKVGRPKLPKGEAKGKIVALWFSADEVKRVNAATKANGQTGSDLDQNAVMAALKV